mgnify:CR=1 FL=1
MTVYHSFSLYPDTPAPLIEIFTREDILQEGCNLVIVPDVSVAGDVGKFLLSLNWFTQDGCFYTKGRNKLILLQGIGEPYWYHRVSGLRLESVQIHRDCDASVSLRALMYILSRFKSIKE